MRSGGKGLAMISVINILMNLLQHETEKYIFIDTCKSQRHPPRIVYATKDRPCHARIRRCQTAMLFVCRLRRWLRQPCLKRHPPAGKQVIFCRPARRDLWCRFGGGRWFQRDNIGTQVCTAPLPKPGPKAQHQIVPNL